LTPDLTPTLILVDNASTPSLAESLGASPIPGPWRCHHLRLASNIGGSGGYNAGLAYAVTHAQPDDPVWLLDSDAVPEPGALVALLETLSIPGVAVAGSLLKDPDTGEFYELGGRIDPKTGEYGSVWTPGSDLPTRPVDAQYLAACSLLTTAHAIRQAGLMPDTFLNGDDVAWGFRLSRATVGRLVATPESVVAHPQWDRMRTIARYFAARNSMSALPQAGVGVFHRAMREAARAATLHATGLHALGDLHLLGLRHASQGRVMGFPPKGTDLGNPNRPGLTHEQAEREVAGKARVVSARARRADFFNAKGSIAVDAQGGWTITTSRTTQFVRAVGAMLTGFKLALRLKRQNGSFAHAPPAPMADEVRGADHGLSIIIVAYNRKAALLRTLERLHAAEPSASAEIIVVDNASSDGTADAVREQYPAVRLVELSENTGVAAFNRGVEASTGHTVLILDDDSWPDPTALALALELLAERHDIAAVALHPRHPDGGRSEWPFARRVETACDQWPVMGCGNLVRKSAWQRVGGYCEGYFLYRNDTDLALSLGTAGKVWFDPSWVVWHDSPAAARKSVRWCHLATRNWLWMAKRHSRHPSRFWAWLGVAQAFRLAGTRPGAIAAVLKGVRDGLLSAAPPTTASSPQGWKALMRLRLCKPMPSSPRYVGPCPTSTTPQSTSAPTSSEPAPMTRST
jgi:GT2 family glycosyltransferase